jgi:hypothetical protein
MYLLKTFIYHTTTLPKQQLWASTTCVSGPKKYFRKLAKYGNAQRGKCPKMSGSKKGKKVVVKMA